MGPKKKKVQYKNAAVVTNNILLPSSPDEHPLFPTFCGFDGASDCDRGTVELLKGIARFSKHMGDQEKQDALLPAEEEEGERQDDLDAQVDDMAQKLTDEAVVDIIATCRFKVLQHAQVHVEWLTDIEAAVDLQGLCDGTLLDFWLAEPTNMTETALHCLWKAVAVHPDPLVVETASNVICSLTNFAQLRKEMHQERFDGGTLPALLRHDWLTSILHEGFGVPVQVGPFLGNQPLPSHAAEISAQQMLHNLCCTLQALKCCLNFNLQALQSIFFIVPDFSDNECAKIGRVLSYVLMDDLISSQGGLRAMKTAALLTDCLACLSVRILQNENQGMLICTSSSSTEDPLNNGVTDGANCQARCVGLPFMAQHPKIFAFANDLLAGPSNGDYRSRVVPLSLGKIGGKPSSFILSICKLLRYMTVLPELQSLQWAVATQTLLRLHGSDQASVQVMYVVFDTLKEVLSLLQQHHASIQDSLLQSRCMATEQGDLLDGIYVALTLSFFAVPHGVDFSLEVQQAFGSMCNELTKHLKYNFDFRFKRLNPLIELLQAALLQKETNCIESPPRKKPMKQKKLSFMPS